MATKPMSLGMKIDALQKARLQSSAIAKDLSESKEKISALEAEIMKDMEQQNLVTSSGTQATVSISSNTVATVKDWDAFYEFIHKKKYYHLLQRRVVDAACRELFETKGVIPGVSPFTVKKLHVKAK